MDSPTLLPIARGALLASGRFGIPHTNAGLRRAAGAADLGKYLNGCIRGTGRPHPRVGLILRARVG
jgi:hypothetical protein